MSSLGFFCGFICKIFEIFDKFIIVLCEIIVPMKISVIKICFFNICVDISGPKCLASSIIAEFVIHFKAFYRNISLLSFPYFSTGGFIEMNLKIYY